MEAFLTLDAQDIASAVGVHGQVFTIVNDEDYYYGDMIRGMIVDKDMGQDIHIYTGSTTGTSRDNEMCSQYAPITWQVDRKCHMISASSFDKMCFDMKMQRDDMSGDLHAHGSRELVHHDYSATTNGGSHFIEEMEINDYPQQARWKVTQKETTSRLQDEFQTAVTLKGQYTPSGKSPAEGERRLYLHLQAQTSQLLQNCIVEIKRLLNEETLKVGARSVGGGGGRYSVM